MANFTVVDGGNPAKAAKAHKAKPASLAALRRQHVAAAAVATLAGTLTFLSVHHLATGYAAVTHCAEWEAVVSACRIDLGFLLLEIAQPVAVRDSTLRIVARWANPAIAVTLAGSAALNSFAFMVGADGRAGSRSRCDWVCLESRNPSRFSKTARRIPLKMDVPGGGH